MKILGKVALITGGAQGLGREFADQLLRRSAKGVCLVDIDKKVGQQTESEFNKKYGLGKAKFCYGDVTKKAVLQDIFTSTKDHFGRLDIVCNNAGIDNEEHSDLIINVNFRAVVIGTQLAIDMMSKQNGGEGGVVVNVGSLAGLSVITFKPLYTATKHAVVGYSRSMGNEAEYDHHGVRVNCLCPGFTETNMTKDIRFLPANPTEGMKHAAASEMLKPDIVGRGFIELVENDSLLGEVMRVTTRKGIDLQNYPSWSKL